MPEWDATIDVDEGLARSLIRDRYPRLDVHPLQVLGIGWDNTVWLTNDGIAFRFPRREIALPGIEREMTLLPELAPRLPFAIPDGAYPGAPTPRFPWPWFGSRLIAGREIAEVGLADHARDRLAGDLGAFLGSLHGLSFRKLDELPVDPMGRADMATRLPRTRAVLDDLDPSGGLTKRAGAILTTAEGLPRPTVRSSCMVICTFAMPSSTQAGA